MNSAPTTGHARLAGRYLFHPGCSNSPSSVSDFHSTLGSDGGVGRQSDMLIKLHSQATTTPKVRAAIQASDEPAWVLANTTGRPNRQCGSDASVTRSKIAAILQLILNGHPQNGVKPRRIGLRGSAYLESQFPQPSSRQSSSEQLRTTRKNRGAPK